jgi:hypothetical protein
MDNMENNNKNDIYERINTLYSNLMVPRKEMTKEQLLQEIILHTIIIYLSYYVLFPRRQKALILVLCMILSYLIMSDIEYLNEFNIIKILLFGFGLFTVDFIKYTRESNTRIIRYDRLILYLILSYYVSYYTLKN